MEFKFVILCMALWAFATTLAATVPQQDAQEDAQEEAQEYAQEEAQEEAQEGPQEENADIDVAESNILASLSALQPSQASLSSNSDLYNVGSFPYEGVRENLYETFAEPQPSLGVSINSRAFLAPQVDVLHLLEDFLTLSSDIIRRLNSLFNENYDLIRVVFNILVKKITSLQTFSVKGISILRKVLEFALNLFSNFSITLPSITFGSTQSEFAPHGTYGVPPLNFTNSFQQN